MNLYYIPTLFHINSNILNTFLFLVSTFISLNKRSWVSLHGNIQRYFLFSFITQQLSDLNWYFRYRQWIIQALIVLLSHFAVCSVLMFVPAAKNLLLYAIHKSLALVPASFTFGLYASYFWLIGLSWFEATGISWLANM